MKRVFSVFILTVFLVGAGTTYASGNPVKSFASWYSSAFQKESIRLGSITATNLIARIADIDLFIQETKESFATIIADLNDDHIRETQAGIEAHQFEMVDSLRTTVVELQKESFDDYLENRDIETEITSEVEQLLEELLNELTRNQYKRRELHDQNS